jgi:transposase
LACEAAGVMLIVPKPLTSDAKADGRFGKQDFVYDAGEDAYRCPAGERLTCRHWNVEAGESCTTTGRRNAPAAR